MSDSPPADQGYASAGVVIDLLCQEFPQTFFRYQRKPLQIGIREELLRVLDCVSEDELAMALTIYTSHTDYLKNCRAGAARVGVDGQLVDHGCPISQSRIDFLLEQRAPDGFETILTNCSYKLADPFVAHALQLVPHVIMLLPLRFLESERRSAILDGGSLARVHVFKNRLPMMHRSGWTGPRATSSICFAWFIWDRNHVGPPTMHRLSAGAKP